MMRAKICNAAFQCMMEVPWKPVPHCTHLFVDDIIIASGKEVVREDELIKAHEKDSKGCVTS